MDIIKTLSLDLETRSSIDLTKCGVYRYAESPDFEILLLAVSVNSSPVEVYDLACGDEIPEEILSAVTDDGVIKYSFNAGFERICLSYWLRRNRPDLLAGKNHLSPHSWLCDLVLSAYNGLPLSLAQVGAVLGLEQQTGISYATSVRLPGRQNGTGTFPSMHWINGNCSRSTTSGMSR